MMFWSEVLRGSTRVACVALLSFFDFISFVSQESFQAAYMDVSPQDNVVDIHNGVVEERGEAVHDGVFKGEQVAFHGFVFCPGLTVGTQDADVAHARPHHVHPQGSERLSVGSPQAVGFLLQAQRVVCDWLDS